MPYESPEGLREFSPLTNAPYDTTTRLPTEDKFVLAQTIAATWDMLCEGPIEGLVSGEYSYRALAGQLGYSAADFIPFPDVEFQSSLYNYTVPGYLRSVYWNEIPVLNKNNQVNFQAVNINHTYGKPNGEVFYQGGVLSTPNDGTLKTTRNVGERLRASSEGIDYSKYYKIFNPDCAVLKINFRIPALAKIITEEKNNEGDVLESTIRIEVRYRPMWKPTKTNATSEYILAPGTLIQGKVDSPTIFSTTVNLYTNTSNDFSKDPDFLGWELKITRITPDSSTGNLRNQTYVDSISEWTNNYFAYPNCAIVRSEFNAEYFSQVPLRAFDTKLLKVKIPSNYNPIDKSYDEQNGGWDGTFKEDKYWTDNPAWCYYDLLTNKRYGAGKYIPESSVDKWTLYQIAKYCDTMVADGRGYAEPRFTCNLYIPSREDAFKVISDMASIFNAIAYYGFGSVYTVQDSPKQAIVQFTNANVENGDFSYSSSSKRARHTVAIVRYNDPTNFFKSAIEYVEDIESVRKYGIREVELTAFGCTSQGQAIRLGRWALLSELLEIETVSFVAGLEGAYLRPGDVFKVFDVNRKANRAGGRVYSFINNATGSVVTLDSTISLDPNTSYKLSLLTPTYNYEASQVSNLDSSATGDLRRSHIQTKTFQGNYGNLVSGRTEITLTSPFDTSYQFVDHPVWTVELENGAATVLENQSFVDRYSDYYRVLRIEEREDNKYGVSALQYNERKFIEIESGLSIQRASFLLNTIPPPPTELLLTASEEGQKRDIGFSFLTTGIQSGVDMFKVYAKKGGFSSTAIPAENYLIQELPFDITQGYHTVSETGVYEYRIYSYNRAGNIYSSGYAQASGVIAQPFEDLKPVRGITVSSLEVANDTGEFSTANRTRSKNITLLNPSFTWQHGATNNLRMPEGHAFRVTIREPSTDATPTSTIYYENTGVSVSDTQPSFDFPFDDLNNSDSLRALGGPFRNYDVVVEAIDASGFTSAGNRVYSPSSRVENGWQYFPNGYDIINVNNPRPSGFDITSGASNPNGYSTVQYYTPSFDIFCVFSGAAEELPNDIAGCFMYYADSVFTPTDARTGLSRVRKTRGTFNNNTNTAYAHFAAPSAIKTGYFAISLFDEIDAELYPKDNSFSTGLYVSNVAPITSRAGVSNFTINGEDGKTYLLETRKNGSFVELVLIDNTDTTNVIILN